jgi:anti-sigma factor RsiW
MHGRRDVVSTGACAAPLDFAALLAYWLGELPPTEEEPLEEHLLGCAHCAGRLEELAALASGIRAAVRAGAIHAVISGPFLEAMKNEGLRLREYRVAPGGSVECTITADDDAVVGRLEAPLSGVKRVDLLQATDDCADDALAPRLEDIPFDAAAGEVLLLPSAAALKKTPAHTWRVRLLAVDASGEKLLGDYAFVHTPG